MRAIDVETLLGRKFMQAKSEADIIEFRPVLGPKNEEKRKLAPAQVIIFPGVRIERREYSLADRLPLGSRKRR